MTRDGLAVTWYGFSLPKQISAAGNNSSTFMYNAHDLRWSQTAIYGGVTETTTYIGGLMEIVVRGGVTAYRHYISGSTGTVAEYIRDTTGLSVTRYITKDHLGSPDAITDSSGAVIVRMSHDAFGDGRNAAGWSGAVSNSDMGNIAAHTRRGFTEHDMLDNLRLIHMNGRVFDPVIGRFISADPFIDGVGSTQGWNRYSYVGNNPLSFTDPSGYLTSPDGNESLMESIFGQLDGGWLNPDDPTFDTLGQGSSNIDRWFNGLLSWTSMDRQEMLGTIQRFSKLPHRTVVSLPRVVPSQKHGAPTPKQQLDAVPTGSTIGGRGTWGDFFAGIARGVVDDWQRMGALYGYSRMIESGQWEAAEQLIRAANSPLLGPIDSPRGEFGYDLAPAAQIVAGGVYGGVRSAVGSRVPPRFGGGAGLSNIDPSDALRIQNAANRTNTTITVVGSRARGTAGPLSDWDYVLPAGTSNRTRHSMSSSLPEGPRGLGEPRNQDFFIGPVDTNLPYIVFPPAL